MTHLQKFLHQRINERGCSPKYRDAALIVIGRILLNQEYYVELGAIRYKPKDKSWIIKKQYEG